MECDLALGGSLDGSQGAFGIDGAIEHQCGSDVLHGVAERALRSGFGGARGLIYGFRPGNLNEIAGFFAALFFLLLPVLLGRRAGL